MSQGKKTKTVRVACPGCRVTYAIEPSLLGKMLKCAKCTTHWTAISPETLHAAGDDVSDIDAELMDLSSDPAKTRTLKSQSDLPHDYWLGKQIGRYMISGILGTGAVGHVYRGHDPELSRDVALKILPQPKGKQMTLRVKLFIQEARAAARLQHPNIVTIHEVGLDRGFYYFAMEVVDGGTIKDLTLALGKLSPARACFLIGQAAQAIAYAHAHNVIHRDVKPDNLMMDQRGVIKVADFGLAEIGEVDLMKLYKGKPIGTPGYIAPETARGEGATRSSDIYCLGLCLYHALTGRKYLAADTVADTVALSAHPPQFHPGRELAHVPRKCIDILRKCLEVDPLERYANAQLLADDLRRFVVEVGRDDSRSPLSAHDPGVYGGELESPSSSGVSRLLNRAARFLPGRSSKESQQPSE